MNIVVLDGYTLNPGDISWDCFTTLGDLKVYDRTPPDQIIHRIGDARAVLTNKTPITDDIMAACPSLKYIGVLATGFNVVDTRAAAIRGITVTNVPTYGTDAVAQHVFALMLELCSHVGAHSDAVNKGRWTASQDFCFWDYPIIEIAGKTLGVVGFGRIGQAVARVAQAFGMTVLANDSVSSYSGNEKNIRFVSFGELLKESDIISLHCPLTNETNGMIHTETIDKMKTGVLIINTSRGGLVVEKDLADALQNGKVGGAGLDVLPIEPPGPGSALIGAPNCIITPHIAWAARESRDRLMETACKNLASYLTGKIVNKVN